MLFAIADYEIVEELYEGNKAVVYRALHAPTQERVIVKALKAEYPPLDDIAKYKREYEIAKGIEHEGVIRSLDLIPYGNGVAIVFQDTGGVALSQALSAEPPDITTFLTLAIQLADALGALHQRQVIHKDLKPQNLIVSPNGSRIKITDFGIASLLTGEQQEMLTPDQLEGTLPYMSPEQTGRMNRAIDYRTDFYSLGVTFYEMLAGQLPFVSDDPVEMIHSHIARQPLPPHLVNPAVPKPLSDIVMRCLAKDAEDRYQSAFGLKRDLEICWNGMTETGDIAEFSIGQADKSEMFLIPAKLYGRDRDLGELLAAYDLASQGLSELVLVSGFSGIGKSALVGEMHKTVLRERGFFIAGKFDQFKRHIPYHALIQALRQLMNQLLTETEEAISQWQERILQSLGGIGQVIVDVIPELELIIGKQPAVPKLPPVETQARFQLAIQNLFAVFTRREHPLVMFLDDLQWADPASLNLMEYFLSEVETSYLLFIGAYRDNEVSASDRLALLIEEMRRKKRSLRQIFLTPLYHAHVRKLIAATLQCEEERSDGLTEIVMQKTGGNPFFVRQFLQSLYADRHLYFDHGQGEWCWDLAGIEILEITDDLVNFMLEKVKGLPPYTQEVLKVAACIGSTFDFQMLCAALNQTRQETADDLWSALQDGLVVPVGTSYKLLYGTQGPGAVLPDEFNVSFKFLHDRVQQVAYSLLPEAERKAVHWRIGSLMLDKYASQQEEWEDRVFDMVNHLNVGREFLTTREEREKLMSLNLIAGQRAKISTAYEPALKYLRQGVILLEPDCWTEQYETAYSLYIERSEVEYLCGNFETAEQCFDLIMQNARTVLEQANVYLIKTTLYIAKGLYEEVIRLGLECINLLGIRLHGKTGAWRIGLEILAVKWNLKWKLQGGEVEDLLNLPTVTDPYRTEAMKIMFNIATAAYFTNQNLFALLALKALNMSLKHGNSIVGSLAYGGYSVLLGAGLGDHQNGYRFAKLATDFNNRYYPEMKSKSDFSFATFSNHWLNPIRTSIDHYKVGFQSSLESGDVLYAFFTLMQMVHCRLIAGDPLDEVQGEVRAYLDFAKRARLYDFQDNYLVLKAMVSNFTGETGGKCSLSDADFDEEAYLEKMAENDNLRRQSYYFLCKLKVYYLYGEYENALEMAKGMEEILGAFHAQPLVPEFAFYYALTLCALEPAAKKRDQKRYRKQVKRLQRQLKRWADIGPENCLHKYWLVSAEIERIERHDLAAMELYDRAIESALEHGFIQNAALAQECAGRYYLNCGREKVAKAYLTDALYTYLKWGATAKARDLSEQYAHLLMHLWELDASRAELAMASSTHETSEGGRQIDLVTLMKASRAISGEIVLDKLLENLINIVVENAGAQKGVLLVKRGPELYVEAEKKDGETVEVLQSVPLTKRSDLPVSVLQYVRRMKEQVVLHDAAESDMFAKDAYFRDMRPKSVLCMPFLNQSRLVGVLYLENNLTTGAFTADRFELLNLLSTQIAAAIENAKLYRRQVELSEAYGKFVPHQFLQLLNKQSITDIAVGDHVSAEMTVLFSDIRSFTTMAERLTPEETFRFLNEYLSRMEPCVIENRGFIDKYVGDGIMSLFDKGADDALRAAIAMQHRVYEYNRDRADAGEEPIEIGIGINTGRLMLGTLGGMRRMDSTVISDAVNLASRIEGLTKLYGVSLLIAEATLRRLQDPDRYSIRLLDRVRVRGKTAEIVLYEVFDADPDEVREGKRQTKLRYETAIRLFQRGEVEVAKEMFADCLAAVPQDRMARIWLERCSQPSLRGYETNQAVLLDEGV